MACSSKSHCDKICLSQRFVEDNFMEKIHNDDFILFTFYEIGICHYCYNIPLDSIYIYVCEQYSDKAKYIIIDSDTTMNRLSVYQFQNVYFLIDMQRKMDIYGINKEVPEVMIFENKKIKDLFLIDRKFLKVCDL